MAKKNVTEQITAEINNETTCPQEQINNVQNDTTTNIDTIEYLVNTLNSLINYIDIVNSRGAFSLEEAGNIWNIIKDAQEHLKHLN